MMSSNVTVHEGKCGPCSLVDSNEDDSVCTHDSDALSNATDSNEDDSADSDIDLVETSENEN